MAYLIHFNPNHDPKTGKFTYVKNKYQNADGSLTEKGNKKFSKLISLKKQYDEQTNIATKAASEEYKYLKKNKLLSKDGESYKTDMQLAYATDENFRPIADKTLAEWKKQNEIYELFAKERSNVANSNYNPFILVGRDIVDQVLKYNT